MIHQKYYCKQGEKFKSKKTREIMHWYSYESSNKGRIIADDLILLWDKPFSYNLMFNRF